MFVGESNIVKEKCYYKNTFKKWDKRIKLGNYLCIKMSLLKQEQFLIL